MIEIIIEFTVLSYLEFLQLIKTEKSFKYIGVIVSGNLQEFEKFLIILFDLTVSKLDIGFVNLFNYCQPIGIYTKADVLSVRAPHSSIINVYSTTLEHINIHNFIGKVKLVIPPSCNITRIGPSNLPYYPELCISDASSVMKSANF